MSQPPASWDDKDAAGMVPDDSVPGIGKTPQIIIIAVAPLAGLTHALIIVGCSALQLHWRGKPTLLTGSTGRRVTPTPG